MILLETYVIEDCINYDSLTSASGKWTIPSGVTSQYSSDGWKVSASSYKQVKLTDKLTSACSVEFTLKDFTQYSDYQSIIIYQYTNGDTTPNQDILLGGVGNVNYCKVLGVKLNRDLVKNAKYRIEYATSTIKVYENDTLIGSGSNNVGFPTRFEFHIGANSRYVIYKDIKVKPL